MTDCELELETCQSVASQQEVKLRPTLNTSSLFSSHEPVPLANLSLRILHEMQMGNDPGAEGHFLDELLVCLCHSTSRKHGPISALTSPRPYSPKKALSCSGDEHPSGHQTMALLRGGEL